MESSNKIVQIKRKVEAEEIVISYLQNPNNRGAFARFYKEYFTKDGMVLKHSPSLRWVRRVIYDGEKDKYGIWEKVMRFYEEEMLQQAEIDEQRVRVAQIAKMRQA